MAITSVSDFLLFINRQTEVQEKIEACLWRMEALISVALMTDGFYELSGDILHSYFSIAGNLIEEATTANQISLKELLKQDK